MVKLGIKEKTSILGFSLIEKMGFWLNH